MRDRRRVCFVMLHYASDSAELAIDTYLKRTSIHSALPIALAKRDYDVHLIHLWPYDARLVRDGVTFHFVAESMVARVLARFASRVRHGDESTYLPAIRATKLLNSLKPDVVHFHGCTLNLNLFLMTRLIRGRQPLLSVHYHGGCPSRRWPVRRLQQSSFRRVDRFCFSTAAHAQPFLDAGLIRDPAQVVELMETSSTLNVLDRDSSRNVTGMIGEPFFLSAGRLHMVKDPLTMLRGFEIVLREWPRAHLYLYYTSDELLPDVKHYLDERPFLDSHVRLRGRAAPEEMESIYNSADFLLQASTREFSGCAVLEAMACGVIPVVSDIPSFRAMTAGGTFGSVFAVGDADGLARAVLSYSDEYVTDYRRQIRAHFDRMLSFDSLAERLDATFEQVLASRPLAVRATMST